MLHKPVPDTGHTLPSGSLTVLNHDLFALARITEEPGQRVLSHEIGEIAPGRPARIVAAGQQPRPGGSRYVDEFLAKTLRRTCQDRSE